MKRLFLSALLLAGMTGPAMAQAPTRPIGLSPTGQPTSYPLTFEPYRIDGYGRAQFGMTPAEVLAAIAAEFPAAGPVADETETVQRTRVLTVVVPELAPGPGAATLSYVFGASSQRLAAVNLSWVAAGDASAEQRQAIVAAGTQLLAGLVGSYWAPLSTARGHVLAPGVIILFASRDHQGHGIEVRLDGVPLEVQRLSTNGTPRPFERLAPPPGSARLRLSLVANPDRPDIHRAAAPGSS